MKKLDKISPVEKLENEWKYKEKKKDKVNFPSKTKLSASFENKYHFLIEYSFAQIDIVQ